MLTDLIWLPIALGAAYLPYLLSESRPQDWLPASPPHGELIGADFDSNL